MNVSFHWLSTFFPSGSLEAIGPVELGRRLTRQGLAVDEIRPAFGTFEGVVVGRVLEANPHPNADRLTVCVVDAGEGERQVVCGAPNVEVGAYYGYARDGARLLGGREIRSARIRDVESQGMLCSAPELGLDALGDREGIWALSGVDDPDLGRDLRELLELDDMVLVLDVTSNRGDAMSHLGIAREAQWFVGEPMRLPELSNPAAEVEGGVVELRDQEGCPSYFARRVDAVEVGSSPIWLQLRLLAAGQRPVNNVVDATNFVMLEVGQPLHPFDFDTLAGGAVIVREPEAGEKIVTLDGLERRLDAGVTVIADTQKAIAIGGVMGGEETEVTSETRTVLLEGAHFDATRVRETSRQLNLVTEAAARFARGVDPEMATWAIDRAADLIARVASGVPADVRFGEDARSRSSSAAIDLEIERVGRLLGCPVSIETGREALEVLGFQTSTDAGLLRVTAPSWRFDIEREADLIEEVGRMIGYDEIPLAPMPSPGLAPRRRPEALRASAARAALQGLGYDEAYTASFVSDDVLGPAFAVDDLVEIKNPISLDERYLRPYVFVGLGRSIVYNLNRRAARVRLFEIGHAFRRQPAGPPIESRRIALAAAGARARVDWSAGAPSEHDFFDIKGDVEDLLTGLGVGEVTFTGSERPFLHPGLQASIVDASTGAELGFCGLVHPQVIDVWGGDAGIFVAEIGAEALPLDARPMQVKAFSREPAVARDLALIVPDRDTAGEVVAAIRRVELPDVETIEVFDRYRGPQVVDGAYSLGVRLVFRADRSLTDEEVDRRVGDLVARLENEKGYRLR